MKTVEHEQPEENIRDVISRMKVAEVIPEKRAELITGYSKMPGGPLGIRIVNEKVFEEFKKNQDARPWAGDVLNYVKEMADKYGEVPMNWFLDAAKMHDASENAARILLRLARHSGGIEVEAFKPNNNSELNFFISEAAYFSRIYRNYHIHPAVSKEFFKVMAYSDTPEHTRMLHRWYDTEGKNLAEMGFGGEQRALLLGCGMTADWIKKLQLSNEEAVATAKQYPHIWREKTCKKP
jgi:hypothetical protein